MAARQTHPKLPPPAEGKPQAIVARPIVDEVTESYLDYAMSVIVSRALPDVRDGLKPVHRRVLYAMWRMGLTADAKFRKSANVIGEVLGKYHPHGDVAAYDALVRMAQDFSLRTPLVIGQGNFGSIDGDSAAAYRYTEVKLARPSHELLEDIDKDTVEFVPNYDGAHEEPKVLPARLPQLLLNGSMGIAVGMATNIPPHNLGELCDAITALIDNPDCDSEELAKILRAPDFPTGGVVFDPKAIASAYASGRGSVVIRAKTEIEDDKAGAQIIVTEIPYQVNKAELIAHIAELVREKKIDGIRDLRDESNKEGIRVVIELKRDAYPKKVLNQLFHRTALQSTFHFNMLALVDGVQPRVLNLKEILEEYLKHRKIVLTRRTQFDLDRALERAHILEGLVLALEDIDRIIATIKKSKDRADAKANLVARFKLSERQAEAILEMKLQQLAGLERLKVEEELKEKRALIKELKDILEHPRRILGIIKTDIEELKKRFAEPRRTQIIGHAIDEFSEEDLIANVATMVMITHDGYIKRVSPDQFKTQGRGGKGVIGLTAKEEDAVEHFFATTTHATLLFFTTRGRVFCLKAHEIPEGSRQARGNSIANFLQLGQDEKVSAVLSSDDLGAEDKYFIMVTRLGTMKKVERVAFDNVRRSGLIAISLAPNDVLKWVKPTTGSMDVLLVTEQGQAIRFREKQVRPMGRVARGVRAIRLKGKDVVVGMDVMEPRVAGALDVLVVAENGFGKRTPLTAYKVQGRGGSGIKTARLTDKTGRIIAALVVAGGKSIEGDLIVVSAKAQVIRLPLSSIARLGRATQGVRIMRFKEEGDSVASVTLI
jgi:DNA gyrase subunit A